MKLAVYHVSPMSRDGTLLECPFSRDIRSIERQSSRVHARRRRSWLSIFENTCLFEVVFSRIPQYTGEVYKPFHPGCFSHSRCTVQCRLQTLGRDAAVASCEFPDSLVVFNTSEEAVASPPIHRFRLIQGNPHYIHLVYKYF